MIHLTGPGGAGKSTVGALLSKLLACPFLDLDKSFAARHGDIDQFIASHGYRAYARGNVELYRAIASDERGGVIALSSGFMTYASVIHPHYAELRHEIASSRTTIVLLPSLDLESCVAETVRRQLARPFARRSPEREEAVIRERFVTYSAIPAPKIETMRPPADVAAEIAMLLAPILADGGGVEHDLRQHEES